MDPIEDAAIDDIEAPGDESEAVASPPAAPAPPVKEVNWRDKYNGQNGVLKKEQAKVTQLSADKAAALEDVERLTLEVETLKSMAATHQATATTVTGERDRLKAELELGRTIRLDFPVLTNLFDKGFLRTDGLQGDALTQYLTDFAAEQAELGDRQYRGNAAGSTPAAPAARQPANETADDLYDALMKLPPGHKDHDELMKRFLDLKRAAQK